MKRQTNYVIITTPDLGKTYLKVNVSDDDWSKIAARLMTDFNACIVQFINPAEWKDKSVLNHFLKNSYQVSIRQLELFCMDYSIVL